MEHYLGFTYPLLGSLAGAVVPILVTVYVVARWRGYRESVADPQLGRKLAFAVFRWISLQLLLAGLAVMGFALLGAGDDREAAIRIAAGLIVPALVIGIAHTFAYRSTNHREHPIVGRMVAGVSLVQTGLVATLALTIACVLTFAKEPDGAAMNTAWAVAVVYGLAWVAQGRAPAGR